MRSAINVKSIVVAGSTGSIGRSTIEIIEKNPGDFDVLGLSAGQNIDELKRQLAFFPDARFAVKDAASLDALIEGDASLRDRAAGYGDDGLRELIAAARPELVINAIVGIAGLMPTVTALESGCRLALANKESLFTAGELIAGMIADRPDRIIPLDSEHFSLSRCLRGYRDRTAEIILTASGGPFFGRDFSSLAAVRVDEVLDHPTWKMGKRVTVDSAHLFNKGLEVVEAHWLFGFPYERIKVVIHPQSVVHSIIRLSDRSLLAHLGPTDMRLSIMNALYYPEMREFPWKSLQPEDLGALEFSPLEKSRYPAFRLALEAARRGGTVPAALNAADEVAVAAFLAGEIGFLTIVDWIEEVLAAHREAAIESLGDVFEADRWARDFLTSRHREAAPK